MNQIKNILFLCTAIFLSTIMIGCGKGNKRVITIHGSTTVEHVIKSVAESYEKSYSCKIDKTTDGSLKGLISLIDGKCEIADSLVKMPAELLLDAQKKGIIVKEYLIAYDIIVPIVHPSNRVNNLFLGQMSDIYTGLIKDWKDVDGRHGTICIVDWDDSSGARLFMHQRFFDSMTAVKDIVIKNSDTGVVSFVAEHPSAVGYISKSFVDSTVKTLTINGIKATRENIESGYYPLFREFFLYVREKSFNGPVKSFIEFVLSESGQEIVQKAGYIPVVSMNKTGIVFQ